MQLEAIPDVVENLVLGHRLERSDNGIAVRSNIRQLLNPNAISVLSLNLVRCATPQLGDISSVIRLDRVRVRIVCLGADDFLFRATQIDGVFGAIEVYVGNRRAIALDRHRRIARSVNFVENMLLRNCEGPNSLLDLRGSGKRDGLVRLALVVEGGHIVVLHRINRRIGSLQPHDDAITRFSRLPLRIERCIPLKHAAE